MSLYGGNCGRPWKQVEQTLGPVSILVNNVGIGAVGGVQEQTPRGLGSGDRDQPQRLLFVFEACGGLDGSSSAEEKSSTSRTSMPSYSAAKGAVVQLTKSMAIELGLHNIQINALAPGFIETDLTRIHENDARVPGSHRTDPGRSLGSSRRMRRCGRLSGVPCCGFCHRVDPCRRWGLRHPVNSRETKPVARAVEVST